MVQIPQASPGLRIRKYRGEVDAAVARVLDDNRYILGPAVERFEADLARYLHAGHCIGVGNGTDALALALRALGVGPGDEVITVALTAAGTAQGIMAAGAVPCFVDVDPATRCMDPRAIEAAITPRTTAIVPVHLFGHPADMPRIAALAEKRGLAVVEDCAQAIGAEIDGRKLGTYGHAAAFSFYPTKNLGAIGDGGAVACRDTATAGRLRRLRSYGWDDARISREKAGNSRLDEMQAAILTVLLPHLDEGNDERRALAAAFRQRLGGLDIGLPPDVPGAVYHQFAITCGRRDQVLQDLSRHAGIGTAVHYHPPLHRQPAFASEPAPRLPATDSLAETLLSLPIQPEVAGPHLDRIADAVRRAVAPCPDR